MFYTTTLINCRFKPIVQLVYCYTVQSVIQKVIKTVLWWDYSPFNAKSLRLWTFWN